MSETEDQIFAITELPQRMNAVLPETVQNMKRHNVIARIMPFINLALARSRAEAFREAADIVEAADMHTNFECVPGDCVCGLAILAQAIREKGEG